MVEELGGAVGNSTSGSICTCDEEFVTCFASFTYQL